MQENERFAPETCRAAAAEINRKGAAFMEKAPAARGYTAVDVTGRRFGRLAALHPTEKRDEKGSVIWPCVAKRISNQKRWVCQNETPHQ